MKGIILSGGEGTRLAPFSKITNKSLFPINNKFVIDYPLRTLKRMGVTDLMIVLGGTHFSQIVSYIKDGQEFGFNNVYYCYQRAPAGIAQAINLCKSFINKDDKFITILGDNIFTGDIYYEHSNENAKIILYNTSDLNRFGVASLKNDNIVQIEEKPKIINKNYLNYAITGLYCLDYKFFDYFKNINPSARGEFEITHILEQYLNNNHLDYSIVSGIWSDAGTFDSVKYISDILYKNPIQF